MLRKLWTKKRLSTDPDPFSFSTIGFFIFHRENVENRPAFFMALRREGAVGKSAKIDGILRRRRLGMTGGRFVCGFVSDRIGDRNMIRIGEAVCIIGLLVMFLPIGNAASLIGLLMAGLGCAPIYPSIIHATPDNFGADKSQAVIGVQMASAYVGTTFMPPLFGLVADNISIGFYPVFLLVIAVCMILMTERLNRAVASAKAIYKAQKAFEGVAEEMGVYSDEDVQDLVNDVRYGKDKV